MMIFFFKFCFYIKLYFFLAKLSEDHEYDHIHFPLFSIKEYIMDTIEHIKSGKP